jgi:1,4-alpha-glucan branching enzyme
VQHLNWLYRNEPALFDQDDTYEGFEWIDFHDSDNSVIAFMRKSRAGETLIFVINATPIVREAYRVGVAGEGWYSEVLNTDAETYGGSNVGNFGGQFAEEVPWQGRSHSLLLRLPPLAVAGFKRHAPKPAELAE